MPGSRIDPLGEAETQVSPVRRLLGPMQPALSATMRADPRDETFSLGLFKALVKPQRHMVRLREVHN